MTAKARDYYVAEVEFLREGGAGDRSILQSLDISAATLMRALYREGRADLARPFARIDASERRAATQTPGVSHTGSTAA